MPTLAELWLPIVLSAAAVWVASALAWMALPHHKGEFKKLPNEDAVLSAVRSGNIPSGQYMFPHCGDPSKAKNDPAMKAKMDSGPWGTLNIVPKWGNMGGKMVMSLIFYLIVSATIAYVASVSIVRDAEFSYVFKVTGLMGIMSYCFGWLPQAIWFNKPTNSTLATLADSIAFGLITGAIFAWRWPGMGV